MRERRSGEKSDSYHEFPVMVNGAPAGREGAVGWEIDRALEDPGARNSAGNLDYFFNNPVAFPISRSSTRSGKIRGSTQPENHFGTTV